jgi:hypothetical protein
LPNFYAHHGVQLFAVRFLCAPQPGGLKHASTLTLRSTDVAGDDTEVANGRESESDPLTPAFLLQLIKLLKRKESLLERAKQHNDHMKVNAAFS